MKTLMIVLSLVSSLPALASGPEDILVRFAYRNPTQGGVMERIDLQGEVGTEFMTTEICGADGKLCACEFQNAAGKVVEKTARVAIEREPNGNYFRCMFSGKGGPIAKVRVFRNKFTSAVLPILSRLTLSDIIGPRLDMNRVRSIYRYTCEFNFLQKEGTTPQQFDCGNTLVSCDPDGDPTKNFCYLKARFPYFLYTDNFSTNFQQKVPDRFYMPDLGLCGLRVQQFSCTGPGGDPQMKFALFAEQTGFWTASVSFSPGPDLSSNSYGFAATPSASTGECPPGLEKRVLFSQLADASDIRPSHNFPNRLLVTEVEDPRDIPAPFSIEKISGGHCGDGRCSAPMSYAGMAKAPQPYSSVGQSPFCVIPAELLP